MKYRVNSDGTQKNASTKVSKWQCRLTVCVAVFDFLDFREFLRSFYDWKKKAYADFSYSVFARRANLKSRSYLRLVISSKRNLTLEMLPRFAKGLELSENEAEAFKALVRFNQAKNLEVRTKAWEKSLSLKPQNKITQRIGDE